MFFTSYLSIQDATHTAPHTITLTHKLHTLNTYINLNSLSLYTTYFSLYWYIGSPDTLICGNCRECFLELGELLDHKRSYCKLRFTCKCQDNFMNTSKYLFDILSLHYITCESLQVTRTKTFIACTGYILIILLLLLFYRESISHQQPSAIDCYSGDCNQTTVRHVQR